MGTRSFRLVTLVLTAALPVASLSTVLLATTASPAAAGCTPVGSFPDTTPGEECYTIPAGTTKLQIQVISGAGTGPYTGHGGSPSGQGGFGATVTETITPPAGVSTLYLEVGTTGGGGGSDYGGPGGGASDVQTCSKAVCTDTATSSDPRLIVAGGGGGGGEDSSPTSGGTGGTGGNAGATGVTVSGPGAGGVGTQTPGDNGGAGGSAGVEMSNTNAVAGIGSSACGGSGAVGTAGNGGAGEDAGGGNSSSGGGGGAGWVGGSGGGAGDCPFGSGSGAGGGGGAGSSYYDSALQVPGTAVSVATTDRYSAQINIVATIGVAPLITSASSTTFTAGTAGNFTVTGTGVPTPTFSETGTLPSGVTLNATTGVLSGTPAASTGGTYPIAITASNGISPNATQAFTLTVDQVAPTVSCTTNASIFNTGVDSAGTGTLGQGSIDANWKVAGPYDNAVPAEPAAPPSNASYSPATVYVNGAYYEDPSYTSSQYIGSGTGAEADYYFKYSFNLDSSVNPADFSLNMDFYADNQVAQVYVNGVPQLAAPQGGSANDQYGGFYPGNAASTTLNSNWQSGENTIVVDVLNGGGPYAFDAQMRSSASCSPTAPSITNIPGTGSNASAVYGGNFTATVDTTNSDGVQSVTSDTPGVCTAGGTNGLTIQFVAVGTCTLTSHVAQGSIYLAADGAAQSFTVSPAPLSITASSPPAMTYGGSVPAVSASYAGFVHGDSASSLSTAPSCGTTATASSPVGTYPTTCTGAVDANYTISYVSGSLAVTPAPLTIIASSASTSYGASIPAITASYAGFVHGDSASSLPTAPTCSTTATSTSQIGTYPTSCSGAVDPNYNITYVNGIFTLLIPGFAPGGGSFVLGDQESAVGTAVTFWGSQWSKDNPTSSGSSAASFKGFAVDTPTLACGATWTTDPGGSASPPSGPLPTYMAVLVTGTYAKSGSQISGNVIHIDIVKTDSGYASDPGHAGPGKVVDQVC